MNSFIYLTFVLNLKWSFWSKKNWLKKQQMGFLVFCIDVFSWYFYGLAGLGCCCWWTFSYVLHFTLGSLFLFFCFVFWGQGWRFCLWFSCFMGIKCKTLGMHSQIPFNKSLFKIYWLLQQSNWCQFK